MWRRDEGSIPLVGSSRKQILDPPIPLVYHWCREIRERDEEGGSGGKRGGEEGRGGKRREEEGRVGQGVWVE